MPFQAALAEEMNGKLENKVSDSPFKRTTDFLTHSVFRRYNICYFLLSHKMNFAEPI